MSVPLAPRPIRAWYPSYVLVVLGLVSLASYYDRNLISILVEPIKRDLRLSDSQIGLLSGVGFALMYGLLGIPMARLADRHGRAKVLAGVVAVWSVMTVLTGRTFNFATMMLARAGVGVGEAGGVPATHALVAEYFSPKYRGMALATTAVCSVLGITLALAGGGFINDRLGWRFAFYAGGLPGLALAALVLFTIREAERPDASARPGVERSSPSFAAGVATLWRRPAYVWLCVGLGVTMIGAYGQSAWAPAFLMRTYHLSAGRIGGYYAAVAGPAALLSIFLAGALNDWLVRRDPRWPLWILAFIFGIDVPAILTFCLDHNLAAALAGALVAALAGSAWAGPGFALVQNLAGPRLRALAAAIFMMVVNIVGVSTGPWLAGALSDALAPRFGRASLGVGLAAMSVTCAIGLVCFLLAARTVARDIADAEGDVARRPAA